MYDSFDKNERDSAWSFVIVTLPLTIGLILTIVLSYVPYMVDRFDECAIKHGTDVCLKVFGYDD